MKAIDKTTLDFLKQIKKNNNREWLLNNRPAYIAARENFESVVQVVIERLIEIEPILKGLEVKSCVYRFNRDIRFSNDKSPYKTNFGALIVKGGKEEKRRQVCRLLSSC